MSLDYDFTQIDDWETLHESRFQLSLSNGLVWACLYIDMNGITAVNWQEFYKRVFIWQTAVSPMLNVKDPDNPALDSMVPYMITPDDVFARVGLNTNITEQPESYFQRKIWMGLEGRAAQEMTKETDNGR